MSELALRLGDDALIAAQRLSAWCANAHELEEDVALANIALDLLGQARLLLTVAGEADGRTEDDLAYLRDERAFRNVQLVELPDGDFAATVVKMLFFSAYQKHLYESLADDEVLGGVAGKAVKEAAYHLDHAVTWTRRLGDGTGESHRRMQAAVDALWPYTYELFEGNELREPWLKTVEPILVEATLTRPGDGWAPTGGRQGIHTEHMGYLLAEMQHLRRSHPGATW